MCASAQAFSSPERLDTPRIRLTDGSQGRVSLTQNSVQTSNDPDTFRNSLRYKRESRLADRDTDLEDLNRQHALRAHQVHYSYLDKGNEAAISSGQAAVKNLFIIHGGALIAMLTFTSGILTNNASTVRADSLVDPMMRFAFGLALAAAASAGTYLTNYCYLAAAHNQTLVWNHPHLAGR